MPRVYWGIAAAVDNFRFVASPAHAPPRSGCGEGAGQSLCNIIAIGGIFYQNRIPVEQGA